MARVLIVDDDPSTSRMLGLYLKKGGHDVAMIDDVSTDDEILLSGDFDIAILDVFMPRRSGVRIAELLQKERSAVKVILITGHASFTRSIFLMAFSGLEKRAGE